MLAFGGGGAGAEGDEVPRDIGGGGGAGPGLVPGLVGAAAGGGGGGAGGAAAGLPCRFMPNAFIAACCAKLTSLGAPFVWEGIGGGAGGVTRE